MPNEIIIFGKLLMKYEVSRSIPGYLGSKVRCINLILTNPNRRTVNENSSLHSIPIILLSLISHQTLTVNYMANITNN